MEQERSSQEREQAEQATGTTPKRKRHLVLISIIFAMFMVAINALIVATAMPSIVGDLGGFSLFTWVFSSYLLIQAVTVPIYGKLADLFGRKPVFTFGIIVFMIGSLLCGFAHSMLALIIYRFIQGFGAGAVQPIATTIVGDMYTLKERAKIQGYLASVWGISSILGPLLGGVFVQYVDWSWVFWINIPLGVIALTGVVFFFREEVKQKRHQIDYVGAMLLLISVSALMVVLIQGGVAWSWTSMPVIFLVAVFVCGLLAFVYHETRAPEPLMPLVIWKDRLLVMANTGALTTGVVLIGVSTFLPTYVQGVMEQSPTVAGLSLTVMSVGWPIASTLAGRLVLKMGFRLTAVLGGLALLIGSILFVLLDPGKGPVWAGAGSFFIGLGMGFTTTTFIISVQSHVSWKTRGVATSSNMFMRLLGGTIGAALLGGILNSRMIRYLETEGASQVLPEGDIDFTNVLLDPETMASMSPESIDVLQSGLTIALNDVYWGVSLFALASLVLVFYLPNRVKEETNEEGEQ
ncbi:EmrB/QacA subfamily drug resistance transporter [Caldalkalibacillus uzonensis]|uniref:EmrB/QacA subfamily drug resistance transporter n=1 Tax=Caldalkalibacillus uzonensis TaxID=353224 RepID=A0ABU0CVG7_9BACI|nr:MDR family MFS transporter [Caldalkalibacillus uzonensis]MDQ0340098.1 EmrB/QacA subfamily drug resistance transporter [Caldalkalibacillus uzonensis]